MNVMLTRMFTIHGIFDKLGGPGKVADLLDIKPSAASEMKRRKSVPVKHWPKIVSACNDAGMGITYTTLVSLHTKSKQPSEAA